MARMPAKTLKALKGSIAKWEAIVAGTGEDMGTHNCPLCHAFYKHDDCDGCPVAEETGNGECHGSPYFLWTASFADDEPFFANTPKRVALAQAELDFLKSLLPEVA